jgi:hypothetical protein
MLMVVAISSVSVTAFANDAGRSEAKQVIDLKDGLTVYIFKGGKMAIEDKLGRAMNQDT